MAMDGKSNAGTGMVTQSIPLSGISMSDEVKEFQETDEFPQAPELINPIGQCIFRGKVEKIHSDFLKNGLVKVRIPHLHLDCDIKEIPYAQVTQTMLSWCNSWNEPKMNENHAKMKAKGKASIDGDLEFKNMLAGGYLVAMATVGQAPSPMGLVGWGTTASGPNAKKGKSAIEGDAEIDVETDDFDTFELTPKENQLRPYNSSREGKDLIRVGDEVLVVSIAGNPRDLIVVDWLSFS